MLLSKIHTQIFRYCMPTQQINSKVFKWTDLCQAAFEMVNEKLCHEPILQYPDTAKPYTLFTNASNYGWVLTQEHNSVDSKGNQCTTLHPIAYVSGLFRGSQLNWAALTKEAYVNRHVCQKINNLHLRHKGHSKKQPSTIEISF